MTNTTNVAVDWRGNGISGGNAQVGKISPSGSYTAPTMVSGAMAVTVSAVSGADGGRSASAQVTVRAPEGSGVLDDITLLVVGLALAARRYTKR